MTDRDADALIVGRGVAGLVTALALARQGVRVTLVGRPASPPAGRTVALFAGTIRFLDEIGAWSAAKAGASPLRVLRVVDDTDNPLRWRPLTFRASEIGLDAFGYNLDMARLVGTLDTVIAAEPGITVVDALAGGPRFGAKTASVEAEGHGRLRARLIVAADGQGSALRQAAGIAAKAERLPQSALIALLDHDRPHGDASTEFLARGGPCTLVPLGAGRSSLVWMAPDGEARRLAALDDAGFADAVERRVHSLLGAMRVTGGRAAIPLASLRAERFASPRLVLVGEAAHAFPPIGAQGLNLGLRDAQALAVLLGEALAAGEDVGAPALLGAYDRKRHLDVASRMAAVSLMSASLVSTFLPADLARAFGMAALDLIPPLRRLVMREGVAPGFRGKDGPAPTSSSRS